MSQLDLVNEYITYQQHKVNPQYRPCYHVAAPVGWVNDPNGFCMYQGEYHLFYQHHPYDSQWGPMHWGHVKSKDLIKWEHLPVALAPDQPYDKDGCFSGSAIEKDGKLYLLYTGNIRSSSGRPEIDRQIQNIAVSEDGVTFTKPEINPVIGTDQMPCHGLAEHFRDPKVFVSNGKYYMVIGSCHIDESGQILLYCSEDLYHWDYVGVLAHSKHQLGKMWECPDIFPLENDDVLIMSPQYVERDGDRYCNLHSSVYLVGKLNIHTAEYDYHTVGQIDDGFDFYAPQTLEDSKGRRIMIAWMQMWERNIPTHTQGHHWAGAMTLPRELKMINGKLYQFPVEEIKNYRKNPVCYERALVKEKMKFDKIEGQCIEIQIEIDALQSNYFGLSVLKDDHYETLLCYNKEEQKFILDRSKSGEKIIGADVEKDLQGVRKTPVVLASGRLKLRIFIDRSSVEVFIQDGQRVMTATVYPPEGAKDIEFFAEGEIMIRYMHKWDIQV